MPLTTSNPEDMQAGADVEARKRAGIRRRFEANAVNPGALQPSGVATAATADAMLPSARQVMSNMDARAADSQLPTAGKVLAGMDARQPKTPQQYGYPAVAPPIQHGYPAVAQPVVQHGFPAQAAPVMEGDERAPAMRRGPSDSMLARGLAQPGVGRREIPTGADAVNPRIQPWDGKIPEDALAPDARIQPWNGKVPENAFAPLNPNIPGMKTIDGRANGLASKIGAHGENVYDNASILRLQRRNGENAQAGVSADSSFGGAMVPNGGPALPGMVTSSTAKAGPAGTYAGNLSAPVINDYTGNGDTAVPNGNAVRTLRGDLQGAEVERKLRLEEIGTALSNIGSLNTRGKKDLFANLMSAKSELTQGRIKQANDFESQGTREENDAAQAQARLQGDVEKNNADRREQGLSRRDAAAAAKAKQDAENDPNSVDNQLKVGKHRLDVAKEGDASQDRQDLADQKRLELYMADGKTTLEQAQVRLAGDNAVAGRPIDESKDSAVGHETTRKALAADTAPTLRNFLRNGKFTPNGSGLSEDADFDTLEFGGPAAQPGTADYGPYKDYSKVRYKNKKTGEWVTDNVTNETYEAARRQRTLQK